MAKSSNSNTANSTTLTTRDIGQAAENKATAWLISQNCHILYRNFYSRFGEIDIIMLHDNALVFLEVRLRTSRQYATASESVNRNKQRRIIRTAEYFLLRYPQWQKYNIRFDVVSLANTTAIPEWIQAAFDAI